MGGWNTGRVFRGIQREVGMGIAGTSHVPWAAVHSERRKSMHHTPRVAAMEAMPGLCGET